MDSWRNEGGSLAQETLTSLLLLFSPFFALFLFIFFCYFLSHSLSLFLALSRCWKRVTGPRSLHYNIHISNERSYLVNELNAFRFEISVGRDSLQQRGAHIASRSRTRRLRHLYFLILFVVLSRSSTNLSPSLSRFLSFSLFIAFFLIWRACIVMAPARESTAAAKSPRRKEAKWAIEK